MAEEAHVVFATTEKMAGFFGPMRLRVDRDAVDLSRLSSPSGLAFLAGHNGDAPLGQVARAEIHDDVGYMNVRLESTVRSEPFLEELRAGIRDGISPGFMIIESEFVEEHNDVVMLITRWQPYEISSIPIPRMMGASLLRIDGSPSTNKASHEGARSGVDLSAGAQRSKALSVSLTAPDTRTADQFLCHNTGRARVTEPTKTAAERRKRMSEIETRVDEKLVDLNRREQALADAEAAPATGAPLALDKAIIALAGLASNPSAPTPPMPGVEVQAANRNHVSAQVPVQTLALTGATTYGSEIQSPTERGDIQPQGRRASRLLTLLRPVSVVYGSKSLPTLDSPPASGMVVDGAPPIPLVDATFRNPSPRSDFHQGQTRAALSLQALILSQKVCAGRNRTNVPTPGYNIQSLFRTLPQHTVALRCAKSLELPQNGFLRGNQALTQGGETFAALVDDSIRAEMAALQATQVIAGDGVAPNVRGIVNTPNIGTSEYLATNRGTAASVRSAEDVLEAAEYGPETRPVWILSPALYRAARMTLREPGNQEFVVSNGRVLGEYPVLKSGDLSDNQAIFMDAEYLAFAQWDMVDLVIDMITSPGNVKITMSSFFDVIVIRPNAVVVMDQA